MTRSSPAYTRNVVVRVVVYYIALFAVAYYAWPSLPAELIPSGFPAAESFGSVVAGVPAASLPRAGELPLMVGIAIISALALVLPVAWVYGLTRHKKGYQQSVVQMMVLLPVVVAGIVVLVKYSLALAFALAGIVAAVRFRNTLDDSKDAVYVFLATAIGLASAVQPAVAAVVSVLFNIIVLVMWWTNFGEASTSDDDQRDVLLRVRTSDADTARAGLEESFDEYLKKWRFGGVVHEDDGTHVVEYAVRLKKGRAPEDLVAVLRERPQVITAELK